jgi:hypothetical protein
MLILRVSMAPRLREHGTVSMTPEPHERHRRLQRSTPTVASVHTRPNVGQRQRRPSELMVQTSSIPINP